MYAKAGELGLPVGHMPFKGLLRHIDDIETLLQQYPATTAIIDHFGFCNCSDISSEEWRRLLALAQYPQVITMPDCVNGVFVVSGCGFCSRGAAGFGGVSV